LTGPLGPQGTVKCFCQVFDAVTVSRNGCVAVTRKIVSELFKILELAQSGMSPKSPVNAKAMEKHERFALA
jgi:hypothetical protein